MSLSSWGGDEAKLGDATSTVPGTDLIVRSQYLPGYREFRLGAHSIRVDREKKQVVIDLKRVVSAPGEPEKLEPSSANGTYPIKITDHDAFL